MTTLRKIRPALILIALAGLTGALLAAPRPLTEKPGPPPFAQVKGAYRLSEAVLLDRHGAVLQEVRMDPTGRRLEWTRLQDISPALLKAVIQAEDRRFYRHRGVDWRACAGALYSRITGGPARGASTITMQLAAQLDGGLRPRGPRRGWREKWRQMEAALRIEETWSKGEILETYLNLITFRGEMQGIATAARGLFDKEPGGLDEEESLILAALIPSAGTSLDGIARRAAAIGRSMQVRTSSEALQARVYGVMGRPYRVRPHVALAPHVARMLLTRPGERVVSTLDRKLQERVLEILNRQLEELKGRHAGDGAVLVVDNRSGDVLAYVANSGPMASAPFVDGIQAVRQAGSSLKPFLYGLALEKEILTAASVLEDQPLQIPTATGLYIPENYTGAYRGDVTLRTALAASLNIPAVRTLLLLGGEAFVDRLRGLGFETVKNDADYYGYSIALGSVDIRLWELVNAYRTLANGGRLQPLRLTPGKGTGAAQPVLDEKAAFIIADILSDRESRSATFGLENVLATPFWTAVKTGTSKDMRDNWCVGYSEGFTVGVWVGNFSGEPMWNVSGVSGAAPVWLEVMKALHRGLPSRPPRVPPGVVSREIAFPKEIGTGRTEWFILGTEPVGLVDRNLAHGRPAIVYPPPGAVIAIDPDIPEHLQGMAFRAVPAAGDFVWVLDQREVGGGSPWVWKPERGSHVLAIAERGGRILDSVRFVVR